MRAFIQKAKWPMLLIYMDTIIFYTILTGKARKMKNLYHEAIAFIFTMLTIAALMAIVNFYNYSKFYCEVC